MMQSKLPDYVALYGTQDTYMLDAGIKEGLELPYSCRGGICG